MQEESLNEGSAASATQAQLVTHKDGRVELADDSVISQSPLYNHDLAPVSVGKRNWTTYNYAALWVGMSACIPTYMLSSSLIAKGMNWWQAIFTVLLGNIIVLIPILLNSHPGTKYGIPFPVFARAAYGTIGSNLPALMRALVACGWFGIQTWLGGEAFNIFLSALIPGWATLMGPPVAGHPPTQWLSFLLFWGLNIFVIYKGMDLLKKVEGVAAPFVLLMTVCLLVWTVNQAHGFGDLLKQADKFSSLTEFLPVFVPALTGMIGFWATLSLNMPDFTRFGNSQKEQMIGQVIALPTAMMAFSLMGVMITSAAVVIYPEAGINNLWDPMKLIAQFKEPWVVAVATLTVAIATLAVNIAANVVSPANDFANAFPRWISFKTGGLITGILGLLAQPWNLLSDPDQYVLNWLVGYSGGLGSIAGVLIIDYWVVRKCKLNLADLYLPNGSYRYTRGWNWCAAVSTILGCVAAWIGKLVPALSVVYDYAWFAGLTVSACSYLILMKVASPKMAA